MKKILNYVFLVFAFFLFASASEDYCDTDTEYREIYVRHIDNVPIVPYTTTGKEILINSCNDTTLMNVNAYQWDLYVDVTQDNEVKQVRVARDMSYRFFLNADYIVPRKYNYIRYKDEGCNSVFYRGTLKSYNIYPPVEPLDSIVVLFDLLPSLPEVSIDMIYDEWDYEKGWMEDPYDDAILSVKCRNTVFIERRVRDTWWRKVPPYYISKHVDGHDTAQEQSFRDILSLDVCDEIDLWFRNFYGDISYPSSIRTEDLITDPLQKESLLRLKESITTGVKEIRNEEPSIKVDGLTIGVTAKSPEDCTLVLYDMQGNVIKQAQNNITVPKHGLYVVRIVTKNKTWNKKISL